MWISGFICTILQLYWQLVQAQGLNTVWQPVNTIIGPGTVLTPFWGSTILLNAFASGKYFNAILSLEFVLTFFINSVAISTKLWKAAKRNEKFSSSVRSLKFINRVLIESGVLYLVITTAHFIVWFTPSSFAISVVSNIVSTFLLNVLLKCSALCF